MDTLRQDTTLGKNLNIGHIWAHFYQQMAWEKTWLFGHLFPISYTVSVSNSASRQLHGKSPIFFEYRPWEKTWLFGHLFPISYTVSVSNSASRDFC